MIRLLADENFNADILRGLRRRVATIDVPRVQDVGMRGADDQTVLEWAAADGRVVLTHDVSTLIDFAWKRVVAGLHHSGVVAVSQTSADWRSRCGSRSVRRVQHGRRVGGPDTLHSVLKPALRIVNVAPPGEVDVVSRPPGRVPVARA